MIKSILKHAALVGSSLLCASTWAADFIKTTTPVTPQRQMYGAAVVKDWLYIIGGNEDTSDNEVAGYIKDVSRAKINQDGSIGNWTPTTPLPVSRSYINNTTLTLNDTIYIVGGHYGDEDIKLRTVLWSRPDTNGNLIPWTESSEAPLPGVSCSTAVAASNRIHQIGGSLGGGNPTDQVSTAILKANGDVTGWKVSPPLPEPLWFHCAGITYNTIFVWGGLTDSSSSDTSDKIFYAPLDQQGDIVEWKVYPQRMDIPHYSASGTVSGKFLISFTPRYRGGALSGDILYTKVDENMLHPFQRMEANIQAKLYNAVATDTSKGVVYLPGGRSQRDEYIFDQQTYFIPIGASTAGVGMPGQFTPNASTTTAQASQTPQSTQSTQPVVNVSNQSSNNSDNLLSRFTTVPEAKSRISQNPQPFAILYINPSEPASSQQMEVLRQIKISGIDENIMLVAAMPASDFKFISDSGVNEFPHWNFYDKDSQLVISKKGTLDAETLKGAISLLN